MTKIPVTDNQAHQKATTADARRKGNATVSKINQNIADQGVPLPVILTNLGFFAGYLSAAASLLESAEKAYKAEIGGTPVEKTLGEVTKALDRCVDVALAVSAKQVARAEGGQDGK